MAAPLAEGLPILYGFQKVTVDSIIRPCGGLLARTSLAATIKPAYINVAATCQRCYLLVVAPLPDGIS
ncbi:MAG: hypothetical protein AAB110_02475 [Candidatus Desantisbacteria bacterium]